ncbi:hypothetical protein SAMN05421807_102324 [Virgibacillus chiguensis]|uniref:Uncharacterized protein n=1 Tax=Virgibacillus chiguensis TaxID=411959 RepID=A0A1M5NRX9_9BACI|nr:hypothetical protein SAMN05421807_102324 [Virgibacillus chiguensis]
MGKSIRVKCHEHLNTYITYNKPVYILFFSRKGWDYEAKHI